MHPRTRRQRDVLECIARYIARNGHEPSYQVIARDLGLSSKAGVAKHIRSLEEQGLLTRKRTNGSFSIELCDSGRGASAVREIPWLAARGSRPEEFESRPIVVPSFLIGPHDPDRMLAFRVTDQAMSGRNIFENDIALIERRAFVRDGESVVVTVRDRSTVLRVYYRSGSAIELQPADDDHDVIKSPADKVEVHGIFRCLLRPAG